MIAVTNNQKHQFERQGILFVVSAASGTGKSTLCDSLRHSDNFIYSVSCTTRKPRPGEIEGEDYFFLSKEEFERRIAADGFLEYAPVHDNYYGTPKAPVIEALKNGTDVLLDIDIQGAEQIRRCTDPIIQGSLVDVFIIPPTFEELERRLRKRGTESEEQIQLRLKTGREEMKVWKSYRYTILSGSMEEDLTKFRAIMRAEHYLSSRLTLL
ncbi:MAG: guanylate kinase [Verrucomicrobiota bacterium]